VRRVGSGIMVMFRDILKAGLKELGLNATGVLICRAVHTLKPERFYKKFHYSVLIKVVEDRWFKCPSRKLQQY
jgi:hypothetical protein